MFEKFAIVHGNDDWYGIRKSIGMCCASLEIHGNWNCLVVNLYGIDKFIGMKMINFRDLKRCRLFYDGQSR